MKTTFDQQETLERLFSEIALIKNAVLFKPLNASISPDWIPRSEVMKFFSYKDTQIAALEKSGQITVARVGKRKFIHRASIVKLIENNILTA
jgi:hypothetical protein